MKRLPIGIQTLQKIYDSNAVYIDKIAYAVRLIEQYDYVFLARPRRFGKSLFLDTLKELFEGNRALFSGLAAEKMHDWSKTWPVTRISFGRGNFSSFTNAIFRAWKMMIRRARHDLFYQL
ncbi:MAG: hypothetical protein CSB33_00010 [Desulfobacterales bacterium]|nr:MAG: hypothetical protein CSB33_00010 [Desulfobacterales bacterium]